MSNVVALFPMSAAVQRYAVIHWDLVAPETSGWVPRRAGTARCNKTLTARRGALTSDRDEVTCKSCIATFEGDDLDFATGLPRWVANALEKAIAASPPAAARRNADVELRRRHQAEYDEILEDEMTVAALAGRR